MLYISIQRFSQLLGTGGVGATPPRRGFTPAPRIQTARKVLYIFPWSLCLEIQRTHNRIMSISVQQLPSLTLYHVVHRFLKIQYAQSLSSLTASWAESHLVLSVPRSPHSPAAAVTLRIPIEEVSQKPDAKHHRSPQSLVVLLD